MPRPVRYSTELRFHMVPDAVVASGDRGLIIEAIERANASSFRPENALPHAAEWAVIFEGTGLQGLVRELAETFEYKLATERFQISRADAVLTMQDALAAMTIPAARKRVLDATRSSFMEQVGPGYAAMCAGAAEQLLTWFDTSLRASEVPMALVGHSRDFELPCVHVPIVASTCVGCRKTIDANTLRFLTGDMALLDEPLAYHPDCAVKAAAKDLVAAIEKLARAAPALPELPSLLTLADRARR